MNVCIVRRMLLSRVLPKLIGGGHAVGVSFIITAGRLVFVFMRSLHEVLTANP